MKFKNNHKIILFGPQACGKGTQGRILSDIFGIPRISTGEVFREEIKNNTALGNKIQSLISKGELVPDEITFKLLKQKLQNINCKNGFILDGYPRNIKQVKVLDELTPIDFAIEINISNAEAIRRIANRRICSKCGAVYDLKIFPPKKPDICDKCGNKIVMRADDYPSAIARRLAIYRDEVVPIIDFYKKKKILIEVNGLDTVDNITNFIKRAMLNKINVKIL